MNERNKLSKSAQAAVVLGVVLICVGVFQFVDGLIPHYIWASMIHGIRTVWGFLWPIALIAAGIYVLWMVKTGKIAGLKGTGDARTLRRSRTDRRFLGVCGGIAQYFSADSTAVRIIAVVLTVALGVPAIIAYFLVAVLAPSE